MVVLKSPRITPPGWDSEGCPKKKCFALRGAAGAGWVHKLLPKATRGSGEGCCLCEGPTVGGKSAGIVSFGGWRSDSWGLPMSSVPSGWAQRSRGRCRGPRKLEQAWSEGKDPAPSPGPNSLGFIPKPLQGAGQLHWVHASPTRSLLLPPGISSHLPLASALSESELSADCSLTEVLGP